MTSMRIVVIGKPEPQGSKTPRSICGQDARWCKRCKRNHLVAMATQEAVKGLPAWRQHVAWVARRHMAGHSPISGPVVACLAFTFVRPASHYRTGGNAHLLRDAAPEWFTQKPDADKLARAVLDALTIAQVWGDDAQCDLLRVARSWAPLHEAPPGQRTYEQDLDPYAAAAGLPDVLPAAGVVIRLGRPAGWQAPAPTLAVAGA